MLSLLYRGRLSSCNYACSYCPFAKRKDSRQALAQDAQDLRRFVDWVSAQADKQEPLRILFTPWGEALVRRHYRAAMLQLAQMPHVRVVALQTNISGPLDWLAQAPVGKIQLWCTYHPSQVQLPRFLERCAQLTDLHVPYSVGVVAMHAHYPAIAALRQALPAGVPVWLNAYDHAGPSYYQAQDLAWLDQLDPWFANERKPSASRGKPCHAGENVFSIEGDGTIQRCHFIPTRLGNLYEDDLNALRRERNCSRIRCECFIGYAHRKDLPYSQQFGDGVLARIPLSMAQ